MKLKDKYISNADNEINPDSKKIVLPDDAYAVIEYLNEICKHLEKWRVSNG